jgi:hypothetical protein
MQISEALLFDHQTRKARKISPNVLTVPIVSKFDWSVLMTGGRER